MGATFVLLCYAVALGLLWAAHALFGLPGVFAVGGVFLAIHVGYRMGTGKWMDPL